MRLLPLLLALLWAGVASAMPGSLTRHTLTVDGVERAYWLYEPTTRQPGEILPLLLAMHGGGGTADGFVTRNGLVAAAEAGGYVLIAPQGLGDEAAWRHSDDASTMTPKANRVAGDDPALFAALYAEVIPGLGIDPKRIFGVGLSAGGMMAYRVACQRPGGLTLRAIGVVSATMTVAPEVCPYAWGVSVLHIHGGADTRVPYEGGGGGLFSGVVYPPVERGLNHFWAANRCDPETEAPRPAPDTQEWQARCPNGAAVVLDYVEPGTHGWFEPASLDATARIAAFFAAH